MKRIKGFVKRNIKLFIGIVVGGIIFGGGVYAATVEANTVSYSNSSSGIAATNVQGAIDALYAKATSLGEIYKKACRYDAFSYSSKLSSGLTALVSAHKVDGWCSIYCSGSDSPGSCMSTCSTQKMSSKVTEYTDCCASLCGGKIGSCYSACATNPYEE